MVHKRDNSHNISETRKDRPSILTFPLSSPIASDYYNYVITHTNEESCLCSLRDNKFRSVLICYKHSRRDSKRIEIATYLPSGESVYCIVHEEEEQSVAEAD